MRAEYPFAEHCSPESLGWLQQAAALIEDGERRNRRAKRAPGKRVQIEEVKL